jgi:parvulin-like peptidyl-prolyl isomerase
VLAVFGGLFVALFAVVGISVGIGHASVPSGAVAVVEDAPNGTVTTQDFDNALKQASARQGLPKPPSPSNPQYSTLRDSAMSDVLLSRWVRGEAEERGITVSDTEISNQLQQVIKQQFGGQKKFQQFLKQAGYTPQQARDQIELSLLTNEIRKAVVPATATVTNTQIEDFYEANKAQFEQPETRDVRQIVNKDQAKVEQAKALLEKDDSSQSWKKVAAKYSTDQATQSTGGLRQGVTKGQSDPAVDQQIFTAAQGALLGPIKASTGDYYLIQVVKVSPATTAPLDKVSSQIKQQLSQGVQQEIATNFQTDFIDKWTSRTFCAKGFVMERCSNFTPQDACNGDDSTDSGNLDKSGCPAFVPSTAPVAPGSATVFPGQAPSGSPQGPLQPGGASAAAQPGVIGPSGAPQLPPGAAPQGTAPQTAPQTAPPSGG